jgi:hypothetical protein
MQLSVVNIWLDVTKFVDKFRVDSIFIWPMISMRRFILQMTYMETTGHVMIKTLVNHG